MVEPLARRGRVRTGIFIRDYLMSKGEAHPSEIHRAIREEYYSINQGRGRKDKLRPPTYQSFIRYFNQMRYFGLVEFSGTLVKQPDGTYVCQDAERCRTGD